MKVLYLSNAIFPDGNAASHRIINNCNLFKSVGLDTELIGNTDLSGRKNKFRFALSFSETSNQYSLKNQIKIFFFIIKNWNIYQHIIFYNYPVFLNLLILITKPLSYRKKVILDITEWYEVKTINSLKLFIKSIDVLLRNYFLFRFSKRLILTSDYYQNLISDKQIVIELPTLFDKEEFLFKKQKYHKQKMVYFGNPFSLSDDSNSEKEKVKLLADEIEKCNAISCDFFGFSYEEFCTFYKTTNNYKNIVFRGKIASSERRQVIPTYLASFVIREDSRMSKVGFPGKLSESLMSSTPVICSDIKSHKRFESIEGVILLPNNEIASSLSRKSFILRLLELKQNLLNNNQFYYDWRKYSSITKHFFGI